MIDIFFPWMMAMHHQSSINIYHIISSSIINQHLSYHIIINQSFSSSINHIYHIISSSSIHIHHITIIIIISISIISSSSSYQYLSYPHHHIIISHDTSILIMSDSVDRASCINHRVTRPCAICLSRRHSSRWV